MNCDVSQRRLLSSERPDRPSPELQQHMARCPVCRALQRRLLQVERQIPLLEVPPSTAKARAIRRLLEPAPATASTPFPLPRVVAPTARPGEINRTTPKERGLQKLALAFALTAALVVFAVGYWAWPQPGSGRPAPDPLAERRAQRDQRLAAVQTPRERVELLVALAEDLYREALTHAAAATVDAETLGVLARFYGEVVRDNLLAHARAIPGPERAELLKPIVVRLSDAESAILRALATSVQTAAVRPLREMASAAREGCGRLQALLPAEVS
jgi:hypothetical protein